MFSTAAAYDLIIDCVLLVAIVLNNPGHGRVDNSIRVPGAVLEHRHSHVFEFMLPHNTILRSYHFNNWPLVHPLMLISSITPPRYRVLS